MRRRVTSLAREAKVVLESELQQLPAKLRRAPQNVRDRPGPINPLRAVLRIEIDDAAAV